MFKKKPEPSEKKPPLHPYAACREVSTLVNMAIRVMGQTIVDGDPMALALWYDLHRIQAMAERIGYGPPTK